MKRGLAIILLILLSFSVIAQEITSEEQEIEDIKKELDQTSEKIKDLESRFTSQIKQEQPTPKAIYVFYLLGLNLLLMLFVIILLFYFYRKYIKKRYGIGEIHPVPNELVDFVHTMLVSGKSLGDIRMELAEKGWAPSMIEHAIDAAKEMK